MVDFSFLYTVLNGLKKVTPPYDFDFAEKNISQIVMVPLQM